MPDLECETGTLSGGEAFVKLDGTVMPEPLSPDVPCVGRLVCLAWGSWAWHDTGHRVVCLRLLFSLPRLGCSLYRDWVSPQPMAKRGET